MSLETDRVRGWVRELLESIVGEIGVSWTKFHAVIDDMELYVKEQEARMKPEGGMF